MSKATRTCMRVVFVIIVFQSVLIFANWRDVDALNSRLDGLEVLLAVDSASKGYRSRAALCDAPGGDCL